MIFPPFCSVFNYPSNQVVLSFITAIQTGSPQLRKKLKDTASKHKYTASKHNVPVKAKDTSHQTCYSSTNTTSLKQNGLHSLEKSQSNGLCAGQTVSNYAFSMSDGLPVWRKRSGSTGSSDRESVYNTSNDNFDTSSDRSTDSITNIQNKSKSIFPGFQFKGSSNLSSPNVLESLCSNVEPTKVNIDQQSDTFKKSVRQCNNKTQASTSVRHSSLKTVVPINSLVNRSCSSGISEKDKADSGISSHQGELTQYPEIFLQWRNKDALCWLDVLLCLSVHNVKLKTLVNTDTFDKHCIIYKLITAHIQAQKILRSAHERPVSRTSTRQSVCSSHASSSRKHRPRLKTKHDDSLTDVTKNSKLECNKSVLPALLEETQSGESKAATLLESAREEVWEALRTKLRCERGQHESPVFAFPLFLRCSEKATELFKMKYR